MKFGSYHPVINFLYFAALFICTICFSHPVCLWIAYLAAFSWSVKLNGEKALRFNLFLIPCIFLYTVWYASYNHFGVTNLWINNVGNYITAEAIVYGFVRGVIAATVIMEFSCVFATITADKVVYLLGRVSPRVSLFCSILLRSVPRIKNQTRKIDVARQGIGRGIRQGNLFQKIWHFMGLVSITITWSLEHLVESAMSMKSRGYSLKGRKAFAIYRFDHRDRCLLIVLVGCIMFAYFANAMGVTDMLYDPVIMMQPMTSISMLFYLIYAVFLLLPLGLQIYSEWKFEKSRSALN